MLNKLIHFFYILGKIYSRIGNKFLSFLVLVIFFITGYFYYNFSYLPEKELIKEQEELELQKELKEEKKEVVLEEYIYQNKEISNSDKIEKIKILKNSYFYSDVENGTTLYGKLESQKVSFYLYNTFIGAFDYTNSNISSIFINNSESDFILNIGSKKYLYSYDLSKFINIDFNIDILYVKKESNKKYIFVTEKGSFIYDLSKNKFEFISIFNDFIIYENGYLGLVKKEDKRVISNLGIQDHKSQIVFYNPKTKDKQVLFKTDLNLEKIYFLNKDIIVSDENGRSYKVKNIK